MTGTGARVNWGGLPCAAPPNNEIAESARVARGAMGGLGVLIGNSDTPDDGHQPAKPPAPATAEQRQGPSVAHPLWRASSRRRRPTAGPAGSGSGSGSALEDVAGGRKNRFGVFRFSGAMLAGLAVRWRRLRLANRHRNRRLSRFGHSAPAPPPGCHRHPIPLLMFPARRASPPGTMALPEPWRPDPARWWRRAHWSRKGRSSLPTASS